MRVAILCLVVALCASVDLASARADKLPPWATQKQVPLEYNDYMIYCFNYPNNAANEYKPTVLPTKDVPSCDKLKAVAEKQPWFKDAVAFLNAKENLEIPGNKSAEFEIKNEKLDAPKAQPHKFAARRLSKGLSPLLLEIANPRLGNLWPARTIPYCLDVGWDILSRTRFLHGMQHLVAATTVRFRAVNCGDNGHKLRFIAVDGFARSDIGFQNAAGNTPNHLAGAPGGVVGGPTEQHVELDGGLFMYNSYSASHEIIHALGWHHTQCRNDRDFYVTTNDGGNFQYAKAGPGDRVYDYESVMHYAKISPPAVPNLVALAAPKAGAPAKPLGNPNNIGQRDHISAQDAQIIDDRYAALPLA